jgi:hypothetical protein
LAAAFADGVRGGAQPGVRVMSSAVAASAATRRRERLQGLLAGSGNV